MLKLENSLFGAMRVPNRAAPGASRTVGIVVWIERILLAGGLILLAFYAAARIEGVLGSFAALKAFSTFNPPAETGRASEHRANPGPRVIAPTPVDFSLWDDARVKSYQESLAQLAGVPMGVLRISKIHLEVPLFDGTDDLTLNRGVGRITGTALPGESGNIGIAGHRDGFFRGLKDVRVGDEIDLETPKGIGTYVVDEIHIVTPDDVDVLRPRGAPSLTLVTCYPFYFVGSAPQRYIVMASLAGGITQRTGNLDLPAAISNEQFKKEKQ